MTEDNHNILALKRLMEVAGQISHGDYDRAQEVFDLTREGKHDPAIGELAEAFGMMLVQVEAREFRLGQLIEKLRATNEELEATLNKVRLLENIQMHLGKFVPQSVKSLIDDNPESPDLEKRDRDVSVLFLDVAGYTKMSEKTSREEMNFLIETYFSAFLDDIHRLGGDINETAGDGLMILFQGEDPRHHALNAVTCALAIRDKAHEINRRNEGLHPPITVNVGINSGPCMVGSTRFEGVSGTRWTFTASGPVTNLAARIGGRAAEGQILIGPETERRIREGLQLVDRGEHLLKNVSAPIRLFEVKG